MCCFSLRQVIPFLLRRKERAIFSFNVPDMPVGCMLVLIAAAAAIRMLYDAVMRKRAPMTLLQQYELYEKLAASARTDDEVRDAERLRRKIHRKATGTFRPAIYAVARAAVFCVRRLPLMCVSIFMLVHAAATGAGIVQACILTCALCLVEALINIASIVSSGTRRRTGGKHFRR